MRDSLPLSRTLLVIVGILLAGVVAQSAVAQTRAATVKDDGSNVVLQSFLKGQLLAPGPFGSGAIPATGLGTRMMWWPKKAAFRAGRVTAAQWDGSNIANYSVAFGLDTQADGDGAVAFGDNTTARGVNAVAMGDHAFVRGANAMAMGLGATATDQYSLSIGECNSKNSPGAAGNTRFVVGNGAFDNTNSTCSSESDALVLNRSGDLEVAGSFVLPDGTVLDGSEDLGLSTNSNGASEVDNNDGFIAKGAFSSGSIPTTGSGTRLMWYPGKAALRAGQVNVDQWDDGNVGTHSVAFGENTQASGNHSVAMGNGSNASGTEAVAMAGGSQASSDHAVALGFETTASQNNAIATGILTTASGFAATAMGNRTTASGSDATAMGDHTTAATDESLSAGQCNDENTSADNTLFVVGNGNSPSGGCDSRSDALVLDESGNISVDGVFESGPTNSLFAGEFHGTAHGDAFDDPAKQVVLIENRADDESGADETSANVLALQGGPTNKSPGTAVNYISFYHGGGGSVGAIQGNGANNDTEGIELKTSGSDYAEELPVAEGASVPEGTDLVGVRGGQIGLDTEGADRVMIASRAPAVRGNATTADTTDDDRRVAVAFIGQVPARVRGAVEVGDLIVPSGKDDGTARAVSPADYRRSTHGLIAGQAWSAKPSEEIGEVTVAVGLGRSGAVAKRLQAQQSQIEKKNEQITALRANQKKIQKRLAALETGRSPSIIAGLSGTSAALLFAFLLGGLLGAGLLHLRRR